eukprot:scaffold266884_cov33-Tisochrysis_lutea.AAC.4
MSASSCGADLPAAFVRDLWRDGGLEGSPPATDACLSQAFSWVVDGCTPKSATMCLKMEALMMATAMIGAATSMNETVPDRLPREDIRANA